MIFNIINPVHPVNPVKFLTCEMGALQTFAANLSKV